MLYMYMGKISASSGNEIDSDYIIYLFMCNIVKHMLIMPAIATHMHHRPGVGRVGDAPIYWLYGFVLLERVWFLSHLVW